jgi:AcrR family transcriptional regulator
MARRLDRRVVRTRKLLRDALMALILEEGYDAISIQDITDKANLGRATFYLHFKDKDELLMEVMDQFIEELLAQVPLLSEAHWQMEDSKHIIKLFDLAAENYDLFRILTIGSGGISAHRQLQRSIAAHITTSIEEDIEALDASPVIPPDFIANHFAGSLLSTIYWWLDNDLPYSVEEMADMFIQINQIDREALMGFALEEQENMSEKEKDPKKKRSKEKRDPKKDAKESSLETEENTSPQIETDGQLNQSSQVNEEIEISKE